MARGCERQPRSRFRLTILMTVAGLAMAALLPAVRSAPGLSQTPRRTAIPIELAFAPANLDESDFDPAAPAESLKVEQEGEGGDPEAPSEASLAADWVAIRSSRGRASDRGREIRKVEAADRLASPGSDRPIRRIALAIDTTKAGLPVRLCRLLF